MVALAYDYRILILQIAQRSERRSKHRVCADKGMPAFGIKLRQSRLHRSYIGKNAFFAIYGITMRNASSVYFTVAALMTN